VTDLIASACRLFQTSVVYQEGRPVGVASPPDVDDRVEDRADRIILASMHPAPACPLILTIPLLRRLAVPFTRPVRDGRFVTDRRAGVFGHEMERASTICPESIIVRFPADARRSRRIMAGPVVPDMLRREGTEDTV
jgi:hypothetical protein